MTDDQFKLLLQAVQSAKSPAWYEPSALIGWAVYGIIGFMFVRLYKAIDDLYKKHNGVSRDLNQLIGQHDSLTSGGQHPCRRKSDWPVSAEEDRE